MTECILFGCGGGRRVRRLDRGIPSNFRISMGLQEAAKGICGHLEPCGVFRSNLSACGHMWRHLGPLATNIHTYMAVSDNSAVLQSCDAMDGDKSLLGLRFTFELKTLIIVFV